MRDLRATDVVVIGGGVAGTTAALHAADRGARVTLLERRGHLGGLATSHDRDGWEIDNGQHVFLRCCTHYRALLDRMDATPLTDLQPRLDIPVLVCRHGATEETRLARTALPLPAPLHLAPSLLRYAAIRPSQRIRAALTSRALGRLAGSADADADAIELGPWLRDRGESRAAVTGLWELLMVGALNVPVEDASLALAAKVVRTGLLDSASGGDIGRARVPLSRIHDGAAGRALEASGVAVRTRTAVRELLRPSSGGRWGIVADGLHLDADAVVLAVPADVAACLAPWLPGPAEVAAAGTSPIVNLHMIFDRPVLGHPFMAVVGSPVQWVFRREAPRHVVGNGEYLVISLSAADAAMAMPVAQLRETFTAEVRRILPAAAKAEIARFVVTRERDATPRFTAGTGRLRPPQATAEPGLGLAGAWTDTGWPATLEGAARSGAAAAAAALDTCMSNDRRVLVNGGVA